MFRRHPGGKGGGRFRPRRRYSLLADHEFPEDMAEALEEVYFKKTGRRRKGAGKGKGSSSSMSFDEMMKGSKGSKGKGKGGFGRFGKGKY